jgi:dolichol-phosphate mannosyltransferase
MFASSPHPLRFNELPYGLCSRQAGERKLDSRATADYGTLLLDWIFGHIIPIRFVAFTLVGDSGIVEHF